MENKSKKEPIQGRGARGSRGTRQLAATRDKVEEKSNSPKPNQSPNESSKPEPEQPSRGGSNPTRGSRIVRRGQNRQNQRLNRRMRQPNRNVKRLERAQNAARSQQRGQRRFRPRRGNFGMRRRRFFGRRSIFIAGLPRNVNRYRLSGLLRKEGRLLRCTILRDRFGRSRGIAFAEMQNPRDAGKIIQKWRGTNVDGNTIFVTFKRNPNRWNYYPRNRFRQFNNYRGFNSRYQRPFRQRGNGGRGRGRGRGRRF